MLHGSKNCCGTKVCFKTGFSKSFLSRIQQMAVCLLMPRLFWNFKGMVVWIYCNYWFTSKKKTPWWPGLNTTNDLLERSIVSSCSFKTASSLSVLPRPGWEQKTNVPQKVNIRAVHRIIYSTCNVKNQINFRNWWKSFGGKSPGENTKNNLLLRSRVSQSCSSAMCVEISSQWKRHWFKR